MLRTVQAEGQDRALRDRNMRIARRVTGRVFIHIILLAGALLYLFPFFWMLSTSLKAPTDVMKNPPVWIPPVLQWGNYPAALSYFPFVRYLFNTLFIVAVNILGTVFSSSIVGYSFARLRWPGRDIWFGVLIATMMLPGAVTMIPQFIMFRNFGWLNSYLPLTVPSFTGSAFNIFLLRQFFRTIPMDLSESAKIDGCPEYRIFYQIVLPLCAPALATIAIFSFMGSWNDFIGPLLYINEKMRYTLTFGLRTFQMQSDTRWYLMMAASIVVAMPTLVVFFSCQKYFIEGITLTGMKG